jgi:ribonuclease P protein component
LGRLETLRRKRDIEELFRRGRRVRGEHLTLVSVRTTSDRQRVLLVASRKTGKAVRRNKLRRWLREAWRALAPSLPPGVDCALILAPRKATVTYWDLYHELSQLLRRARLLPTAPE